MMIETTLHGRFKKISGILLNRRQYQKVGWFYEVTIRPIFSKGHVCTTQSHFEQLDETVSEKVYT